MSAMNDKLKSLFEDLGKPTMRGVRKCPKCGTYNGTRGLSCKNKACDVVFKETGERKKSISADVVKIITGSTAQVYSVRVRDRGPDYRGFVQLPLIQGLDSPDQAVDISLITQTTALCFVETCQKNNQEHHSDLSLTVNPCQHIKASINCYTEAQPLTLKNSVLNALPISSEIKQAIWLLATETTGPLVQRVSKNIMVVKCKPNPKHPLGFLHFAFFEHSRKRDAPEHKFQCSCRSFKAPKPGSIKDDMQKRCVHFYACICAFASDEKLTEEFSFYINLDVTPSSEHHLLAILTNTDNEQDPCEVKIELMPETGTLITAAVDSITEEIQPFKKRKKDESLTTNLSLDESTVSISFQQWLASITEQINQTMHYQFDGHPEPLVFHAPQAFFDCLQQRISTGSKKKRLPNATTAFVRKDALPLGTFSKYTWHITNILHVKQIFDTPEMPLEVTRSFIENRDGTYDLYEPPKDEMEELAENFKKTENTPLIKPFELKTFLRVGSLSPDQKEPTPFIIEWIPDILPKSRIGELRIKFEYGHQRNGHVERRSTPQHVIHIQQI